MVLGDRSPAPQVHVELAVGETVDDAVGPAHGQRGLADSGGTDDHGAAAARAEQPVQLVQMPVPSGEADDVGRQLRRGRAGSRWRREARVVAQDRDLQLAQHGTRLDPEVVAKLRGQPPEGFERLGRATAPVQSEHLRADQALAARMLGDQRGQFTGQLDMPTELEFGLDPVLQRGQPLLLQAGANPLAQSVGRRVGERRTAPQLQRRTQAGGPVTGVGRGLGAGEQGPETVDVDPIGRYAQDVALVSGDERDVALPPQRGADPGHRRVDARPCCRRRAAIPQQFDQPAHGHHAVAVQQQHGEQAPVTPARQGHRSAVGGLHLDGAEQSEVHAAVRGPARCPMQDLLSRRRLPQCDNAGVATIQEIERPRWTRTLWRQRYQERRSTVAV